MEKKKNPKAILLLTAFLVGCFGGGVAAGKIFKHISPASSALSGTDKTALIITAVVSLFISYLLIIIIHEAGHLVFGLLSGYRYLLFRIGSLTLIKRNNKFEFKKLYYPCLFRYQIYFQAWSADFRAPRRLPVFLCQFHRAWLR